MSAINLIQAFDLDDFENCETDSGFDQETLYFLDHSSIVDDEAMRQEPFSIDSIVDWNN
jgi:hypothetical protein